MSAATRSGFLPCLSRRLASLATVVVLPEPCKPTILMPDGRSPLRVYCSEVSTGPISASSSSWQILMKWSPGAAWSFLPFLSAVATCTTWPMAFSFTRARKRLATLNSTSASSSATRMSRSASSMLASVSSALPVSLCLAARKPLVTASSMRCSSKEGAFYHREDTVEHALAHFLSKFTYLAIVGVLTAAGLGVPISDNLTLLLAGGLAARGVTDYWPSLLSGYFGVLFGDVLIHHWGQRMGPAAYRHRMVRKHLSPERKDKLSYHFARHGFWTVVVGRHTPMLRAPIFFLAGASHVPLWKFALADALSAAVTVPIVVTLGYEFAEHLD